MNPLYLDLARWAKQRKQGAMARSWARLLARPMRRRAR